MTRRTQVMLRRVSVAAGAAAAANVVACYGSAAYWDFDCPPAYIVGSTLVAVVGVLTLGLAIIVLDVVRRTRAAGKAN